MRTNLLARRLRVLSQATAVCAVAGLATACSSDVSRLDSFMTASVSKTDNQRQIVGGGQPGLDAYAERHETSSDGIRVGSPQSTLWQRCPFVERFAEHRNPFQSSARRSTSIGRANRSAATPGA